MILEPRLGMLLDSAAEEQAARRSQRVKMYARVRVSDRKPTPRAVWMGRVGDPLPRTARQKQQKARRTTPHQRVEAG